MELWNAQGGVCPYTGLAMQLPASTVGFKKHGTPTSASLDRIDPTGGYVKGNVEFVCRFVNMGKQAFNRKAVQDFIQAVRLSGKPGMVEVRSG